jgi:hypothetical protein
VPLLLLNDERPDLSASITSHFFDLIKSMTQHPCILFTRLRLCATIHPSHGLRPWENAHIFACASQLVSEYAAEYLLALETLRTKYAHLADEWNDAPLLLHALKDEAQLDCCSRENLTSYKSGPTRFSCELRSQDKDKDSGKFGSIRSKIALRVTCPKRDTACFIYLFI